jgi:hypothetical protein
MVSAPVIAQSSAPPIRDNSVTSASIKNGEVKTEDLANNAVTSPKIADGTIQQEDIADGVVPGGVQPTVHIVDGPEDPVEFSGGGLSEANCPSGEVLTGGGASVSRAINVEGALNGPWDEDTWRATAYRTSGEITPQTPTVKAFAVCLDFSP